MFDFMSSTNILPRLDRWAMVSHALTMILSACPPQPTLLTILLDVCLASDLVHQSHILLRALLTFSFTPVNYNVPSPISHPAHTSYLVDLCATWSKDEGAFSNAFNLRRIFTGVLIDILADISSADAWSCKAVTKLAREHRKKDFVSFVSMSSGLARFVGKAKANVHTASVRSQLAKWVGYMLKRIWAHRISFGLDLCLPTVECHEELVAIADFLAQAKSSGLHLPCDRSGGPESHLPDAIACIATCYLTVLSDTVVSQLTDLLWEIIPSPSTFNDLVTLIIGDDEVSYHNDWYVRCMHKLHEHASLLRSKALLKLEASLWACALGHSERDSFGESVRPDALKDFREKIIAAVDDAERRCFGEVRASPMVTQKLKRRRGTSSGEWEWEEMVGSWIRRSPVNKRGRVDNEPTRRVLRSTMSRQARNHSISTSPTPSASALFSAPSTPDTLTDASDLDNDEEVERTIISEPGLTRRNSNFASILANAQTNRTVLHKRKQPSGDIIPTNHRKTARKLSTPTNENRRGQLVPSVDDSFSMLPSDDSLDLFAYTESSPLALR